MYYLINAISAQLPSAAIRARGVSIILEPLASAAAAAQVLASVDPLGQIERWPGDEASGALNAIGHTDTDRLVRALLAQHGYDPGPGARMTVAMELDDCAILAQYVGPRLPEGVTTLPEGARFEWFRVLIAYTDNPDD